MGDTVQLIGDVSDISQSSAIVILNTLVEEGRLIEERAEYLKKKFRELHDRVLVVYRRDNFLLKRARQLRRELDAEKEKIITRGNIAVEDDAEIQRLKKLLLDAEKELSEAQERESILQVEALEFDRKKHTLLLERQDAIAAEEERLRPRLKAIQMEIAAMGKEIEEMGAELLSLGAKRDETLAKESECKEKLLRWNTIMADATKQLSNVEKMPERALRQTELVVKSYEAAQLELYAFDSRLQAQTDMIAKLELKKNTSSTEYSQAQSHLQKLKAQIDSKRVTLATLNSSLKMELEARQGYQQRISQLEQLIKTTHISGETELGNIEQVRREIDRANLEFTELERGFTKIIKEQNDIKESIVLAKRNLECVQAARKRNIQRLEDAERSREKRNCAFIGAQGLKKDFIAKVEAVGKDIAALKCEIAQRAAQELMKHREQQALTIRRQELNRDCGRENSRIIMGKNELRMKEIYVSEVLKRRDELEQRLSSMVEVFQKIRAERSHKAAQIQAITQKMTELSEKKTILENEIVVLCRESALKEAELTKKRRRVQELRQFCKNLRIEKSRQHKNLEKVTNEECNVKNQVRRMNGQISSLEEKMVDTRERYHDVIKKRNHAGIELFDRNDELCVLHERVNAQEKAIRNGILMDNARNEEIRVLKCKLADLQRGVEVIRGTVPKVRELENQLALITDEIDDERWRVEVLEDDLTNPKNPHRWRLIKQTLAGGGSSANADTVPQKNVKGTAQAQTAAASFRIGIDGPSDEFLRLQKRCQELEERVNAINERIREKDLILEEVTELSSRLSDQVKTGREFTLALAKQVNSHHSSIRAKTRQIMATVSELSIFQASAIQLQQEVERLEVLVEEAERLMEQGQAPFAEAEEQYLREMDSRRRHANMLRRRKEAEKDAVAALKAVVTTAEQRPNAYIPDDKFNVPKPYGALVPFKPTPTFQSARFYRALSDRNQFKNSLMTTGKVQLLPEYFSVDDVSCSGSRGRKRSDNFYVTY